MSVAKLDVIEQYLDNNGALLAGGLISTYEGGTTTPLAVYTDATGLVAHANPITLDSSGRPPGDGLWFTTGTAYKVIVKTAAGVTFDSIDNLIVPDSTPAAGSQYADVVVFYAGGPPAGSELIYQECATRAINFAAAFSGSFGKAFTDPTASFVVTVRKNATSASTGTAIGTITVATDGGYAFATTAGAAQSLAEGDNISFWGPSTADTTIANFGFTLAGTLA